MKVSYSRSSLSIDANCANTAGDAFVRELEFSKVTLRLKQKEDRKGEGDNEDHTIAKLQGNTIDVLQRCLVGLRYLSQDQAFTDGFSNSIKTLSLF